MVEQNTCNECKEPIFGRIDKKFCSDQCRNTYNNRLNRDANNHIRNINNILRKNRRILVELNPTGKSKVHKNKLLDAGFKFDYFTNIYTTKKEGKQYFFCYEHGYLPLGNDYYALVVKKEYV